MSIWTKLICGATICFLLSPSLHAQKKLIVRGIIKDSHSEEVVPYASVELKKMNRGIVGDSAGNFELHLPQSNVIDTLIVTYVGFARFTYPIDCSKDTINIVVNLQRGESGGVVVKSKHGRGWILWKKVVRHKTLNNKTRYENYSYEVYNKLELDLNKVNKEKMANVKILKPFTFLLKNVDTIEYKVPVLPVYLTETLSDYYHESDPAKTREIIKAAKTDGIENESLTKQLGATYQNVNIYENFLPVFNKQFTSPLSDNGDNYYDYSVPDTQYFKNRRTFHLVFTPKHSGENSFSGDAWVDDSTYAITRITMHLGTETNINFLTNLSMYQEFALVQDSLWFLSKDKFFADINPIGKNSLGFKGKKTSTYRNVILNSKNNIDQLATNRIKEEVVVMANSNPKPDSFWTAHRHEKLDKNEKAVYTLIDTLQKMPLFQTYYNLANIATTGYIRLGNYYIGPWYNWFSTNYWEGTRSRFDVGTREGFNKYITFHGYLAYGTRDATWKGQLEMFYQPKKSPRTQFYVGYKNDLDFGLTYAGEVVNDNILTYLVRKPGVPRKYMRSTEKRFEFYKENRSGLSGTFSASSKQYTPLIGIPLKGDLAQAQNGQFNNFETSMRIRFSYLERFITHGFDRVSLGSDYPTIDLRFTHGFKDVLKSSYDYNKLRISIDQTKLVPPFGSVTYSVYAGKVWGTLPYMLLEVHPGNDLYYYRPNAYNLMQRFEFLSDQYAGVNFENNVGQGLFKLVPITRKLKWRQFWNAKMLFGSLSDANKQYNFNSNTTFQSLNGQPYMELGTGIDNIFKFFRLDFVWRVLPTPLPANSQERFGIFGSFRVSL